MGKNDSPVKELRERIGVSQRELADALGVHHALIANLEMNVIDIKADDEETQSKVSIVFDKLSKYSGIPKNELLEKQSANTKAQQVNVRERVIEQIGKMVEKFINATKITNEEEYDQFEHELRMACLVGEQQKSPLKVIREVGGITQRQFSQAVGASQTLIARIELGELSLAGPSGGKIIDFILEGLGIKEAQDNFMDFFEVIDELQEEYMKKVVENNLKKVESAFQQLKEGGKGLTEDEKDQQEGNMG